MDYEKNKAASCLRNVSKRALPFLPPAAETAELGCLWACTSHLLALPQLLHAQETGMRAVLPGCHSCVQHPLPWCAGAVFSAVLLCAALKSVLGGLPFFSSVLTLEIQILVAVPGAERFLVGGPRWRTGPLWRASSWAGIAGVNYSRKQPSFNKQLLPPNQCQTSAPSQPCCWKCHYSGRRQH